MTTTENTDARADAENARNAFEEVYLRADVPDRWLEAQRDAHDAAVDRLVAALAAVEAARDEAVTGWRERDAQVLAWELRVTTAEAALRTVQAGYDAFYRDRKDGIHELLNAESLVRETLKGSQ